MKLVIDIPDKDYEFIKDLQSLIIGGRGNCKTIQYNVINAIKNGTPYEERPKGKWIAIHKGYVCSNCNKYTITINDKHYCFKCGADMRGDV